MLDAAAGAGLESAVKAHVRRARAEGATREQLHHVALLCTTTVGFPRAVAVHRWVEDQTAKD